MPGLEMVLLFFGMSLLVAVPLGVLLGLPLLAWNLRALIRIREGELGLRRLQTVAAIRGQTGGLIPTWVDSADPDAVLAWVQTEAELGLVPTH